LKQERLAPLNTYLNFAYKILVSKGSNIFFEHHDIGSYMECRSQESKALISHCGTTCSCQI